MNGLFTAWVRTEEMGPCDTHPERTGERFVFIVHPAGKDKPLLRFCTNCQAQMMETLLRNYYRARQGRDKDPVGYTGPLMKETA